MHVSMHPYISLRAPFQRFVRALSWIPAFLGPLSPATGASSDEPTTTDSLCTAVYLIAPHVGIGPFNEPVKISVAVDGGAFEERGYLWRGDWGAFHSCGQTLALRMQRVAGLNAVAGPTVHDINETFVLSLEQRDRVYFLMGWRWREVPTEAGQAEIAQIEKLSLPPCLTRWRLAPISLDKMIENQYVKCSPLTQP